MLRAGEGAAGTDHLWAKAAQLERDFAGYKHRLAERRAQHAVAEAAAGRRAGGGGGEEEPQQRVGDAAAGRGRRYEEYVRRRDERLRHEWRARMERKEAEVQALWARLDRTGSRSGSRRAGGDDHGGGELAGAAATGHAREDQGKPAQKPGNLVVKVKPSTPVTPRGNPGHPPPAAGKLTRPRTSVPSSLAAGNPSARLSTPDPRRRPPHLHRVQPQPQPPAAPRKENRLPPPAPSTVLAAAASPATPRPRTTTMLSRSRSMFKDRGCSSVGVVGESPRPPRFQPPRSSYDDCASRNLKEPNPSPRADDAIAVVQRSSSSREQTLVADRKKASAVAPEPPFLVRRTGNGVELTSPPVMVMVSKDLVVPDISEITTPACRGNADNKSNQQEHIDHSSDKFGSEEITGDSDTEPSYVYIKKDSDEQMPRPQASAGLGTWPGPEPARSDSKEEDSDNVDDTLESTGSNEVAGGESPAAADADEELRRESSESLYSNVHSSFSQRSDELDTSATDSPLPSATEQSPESNTAPWSTRKSTEVEDAEKRLPTPTTVQSPIDAVNGLKRLLTFGKRNGNKASEAAPPAVQRATLRAVTPAPPAGDDDSVSGECPAPAGGSAGKLRVDSSDDLDNSYVISPHVGSLQSIGPCYPASSELKEPILHAKSPRVHRSFFSFSSFKSRAN